MKIGVVGGGIAGLASAWALCKAGHRVSLFEQGPIPNPLGASGDHHRIIREGYAGQDGYVVVSKVQDLESGQGYNAATDSYGDLISAGIIDPVKVTRSALRNAASIAALVLTTETLVVEKKDDEDED